jgi:hypothetical protein
VDLNQPVSKDSTHLPCQVFLAIHVVRIREGCLLREPLAKECRELLRETHLDNLEVVKYLCDIFTDPARAALKRGPVERELGRHVDDYADSTGGGEEE